VIRADLHHHDVEALLLRRTDYGESDLIVTVLTDSLGARANGVLVAPFSRFTGLL
jgi:recombinational DNA repair protein (RecF pathway)